MSTGFRRVCRVGAAFTLFMGMLLAADPAADSSKQKEIDELRAILAAQQKQMAAQQRQIDELKAEMKAEHAEPSTSAPAVIAAPRKLGEVASLSPVIPVTPEPPPPSGTFEASQPDLQGKLSDLAYGKVKIGATFYGDYAFYTDTGFGPQFLTQSNQPGPGNDHFNSFDVTRTYINLFYTPNDAVTLRFTPNIYRQVDGSSAMGFGKGAAIGSTSNGNLGFRLKYAYIDFNTLFKGSKAFKDDKLTFGQTTNPLVDWEEGLYGYRYASLTPWNYLSLSSTYTGVTLHGPVEVNGREVLDYHIGIFNNASFHAIETNDKKQAMARLTWYPVGTTSDRTGFGITGFYDYGYNTKTPDSPSTPDYRLALIVHYQSHKKGYELAGEYDKGRNAFSSGNLFSGSGPADAFGMGPTLYATFNSLAGAILAGDRTKQQGFDFFGHVQLGHSPFKLFGMFERFQPNTNVSSDPLDFQRTVAGISYTMNSHFEFAVDDQNLMYTHSQFTMPASQISAFSPSLAAANPNGIPNAVPNGTNAIMLNVLFNY